MVQKINIPKVIKDNYFSHSATIRIPVSLGAHLVH